MCYFQIKSFKVSLVIHLLFSEKIVSLYYCIEYKVLVLDFREIALLYICSAQRACFQSYKVFLKNKLCVFYLRTGADIYLTLVRGGRVV